MPRYGSDGVFHGYVGGCVDITDAKHAEHALRYVNRKLILAQEDERRRIARDLHDHLSQQLALLAIDLQQISVSPPNGPDALRDALQEAWGRTAEIASDVHAISHRLHPSKMEALGLVATIRAHCRDVSRQSLSVHFSEKNVPAGISPDVSLGLFRVLEEALTNVARHSGAREAHVTLDFDRDVVLRVSDTGKGFKTHVELDGRPGLRQHARARRSARRQAVDCLAPRTWDRRRGPRAAAAAVLHSTPDCRICIVVGRWPPC